MLTIEDVGGNNFTVEWLEETCHVFDCCGLNQSDVEVLQELKASWDTLTTVKQSEMCGMLRFVEDGLMNGYLDANESTMILGRIRDSFNVGR